MRNLSLQSANLLKSLIAEPIMKSIKRENKVRTKKATKTIATESKYPNYLLNFTAYTYLLISIFISMLYIDKSPIINLQKLRKKTDIFAFRQCNEDKKAKHSQIRV